LPPALWMCTASSTLFILISKLFPAGPPIRLTPSLLRLRLSFYWPLWMFINYIYLLTYLLANFLATICKTVHPVALDRCLLSVCLSICLSVCLSVCHVCSVGVLWPNVRRIQMKLGMQVGLGLGHILLDGDQCPHPQRGTAPHNFRPISVLAKWLYWSRFHLVGR